MNKRQKRNLDLVSSIDEDIIDKNTDKRIKLWGTRARRGGKKLVVLLVALIALVAILASSFVVMFLVNDKQTPIYKGMTVSLNYEGNEAAAQSAINYLSSQRSISAGSIALLGSYGDDKHGGDKEPHVREELTNIVDDSIPIEIPEQSMYYANPNTDIYITVHLSNPDNFEIMSFTLNGNKYSSYMFEDGSDMENLVLKCNVGDVEGVIEYTIDAIKYIDGTEIKDVIMAGDKTVKIGVATEKQPEVIVTKELIGINSVSFDVSLSDELGLISKSSGAIYAVVCDEDELLGYQKLSLTEPNSISFEGLEVGSPYRYAVVAYYDMLDGSGMNYYVLYEKNFETETIFAFDSIDIGQEYINFGFEWNNVVENKALTSFELYRGEEKVSDLDVNATSVNGLLSNNAYTLIATFEYQGQIETVEFTFCTLAKAVPEFTVSNLTITEYTISGEYSYTNEDDTLISYNVGFYKGDELICDISEASFVFEELDYYTDYAVRFTYTYDLCDGVGVQSETISSSIKTLPYIDVTDCNIVNTSAVVDGGTIYMQVKLDNPLNVTVNSVVVGGKTYSVTLSSNANNLFVEIVYDGQFKGGDTYLSVDQIKGSLGGVSYTLTPQTRISDNVYINGKLEVLNFECVNEDFEPFDWAFPSDTVYLLVTVDNPTGYTIDSISIAGDGYIKKVTKLDDNRWYCLAASGGQFWSLDSLSYSNEYVEKKTVSLSNTMEARCFRTVSDEIKYISSADDLKNMNGGYYYELTGDIDLAGIEWHGSEFKGVFEGNGYSIKNMSFVGSTNDEYLGLFSRGSGFIRNVHLESAIIIADVDNNNVCFGGLVGGGSPSWDAYVNLFGCSVDDSSVFDLKVKSDSGSNSSAVVGGLVGYGGMITNCYNGASISVSGSSLRGSSCWIMAGGLAGSADDTGITNCYNVGDVTTSGGTTADVGGLAGCGWGLTITNCFNAGKVTTDDGSNGGLLEGSASAMITNSYSLTGENSDRDGDPCTVDQLNSKEFYTETLGWSEDVWDFSDLDFENGKYPILK